jgi:hypothetical protein
VEGSERFTDVISRILHSEDEVWSINGPLFLNDKPYWSIHFMRRGIFKKFCEVAIVILNENGEIIREWEVYEKIVLIELMPKLSEKFAVLHSNEMSELSRILKFFQGSQESIHGFRIDTLIQEAKKRGINELVHLLESFIEQLLEIEKDISKVLKYMEDTVRSVDELLRKDEYSTLIRFAQEISFEKEGIENIRRKISDQAHIIFYVVNIVRELGMRKEESRKFIESINAYVSSIRQVRKKIDQMIKTRQFILNIFNERRSMVGKFYKEMLKRT